MSVSLGWRPPQKADKTSKEIWYGKTQRRASAAPSRVYSRSAMSAPAYHVIIPFLPAKLSPPSSEFGTSCDGCDLPCGTLACTCFPLFLVPWLVVVEADFVLGPLEPVLSLPRFCECTMPRSTIVERNLRELTYLAVSPLDQLAITITLPVDVIGAQLIDLRLKVGDGEAKAFEALQVLAVQSSLPILA